MPTSIRDKISELRKARAAEKALAKEIAALNAEITADLSAAGDLRAEFAELSNGAPSSPSASPLSFTPSAPTILCGKCNQPVHEAALLPGSDNIFEIKCHGEAMRLVWDRQRSPVAVFV